MKQQKTGKSKRVLTFRLDDKEIKMLDEVTKRYSKKYKVKLDRTKMIRILIKKNYTFLFDKKFQEQEQAIKDIIHFNIAGFKKLIEMKKAESLKNERKETT